jgi:hypothetical protein
MACGARAERRGRSGRGGAGRLSASALPPSRRPRPPGCARGCKASTSEAGPDAEPTPPNAGSAAMPSGPRAGAGAGGGGGTSWRAAIVRCTMVISSGTWGHVVMLTHHEDPDVMEESLMNGDDPDDTHASFCTHLGDLVEQARARADRAPRAPERGAPARTLVGPGLVRAAQDVGWEDVRLLHEAVRVLLRLRDLRTPAASCARTAARRTTRCGKRPGKRQGRGGTLHEAAQTQHEATCTDLVANRGLHVGDERREEREARRVERLPHGRREELREQHSSEDLRGAPPPLSSGCWWCCWC